jgi:benzoyl-CoA reductase/2-hydroxyglutaryl-CoA dehydratase subunit BcrC/BadD/HgdB
MAQSISKIQTRLMRDYYKYFSKYAKGTAPENKVAWVTAFTPVEILEAVGVSYYYPESYAAVIAASEREQELLEECDKHFLSRDCCAYSCCIEGCLELREGPRGIPPQPDVLIATNNQCNTLPNWWNILADRFDIPLIVIDYPGENSVGCNAFEYVTRQHRDLIAQMEELSGNKLDMTYLAELISNSERSVASWNKLIRHLKTKEIKPTMLFDDITYLITNRCNTQTSELYEMMEAEIEGKPDVVSNDIPIFWLGYPLWYHSQRYLSEAMDGFRIAGSNYITWWSLDYSGDDVFEKLYHAYNFTFLNLSQERRNKELKQLIDESGATCAITLHNKSCKCDFVSARNIDVPQAELEIDMIDREFLDVEKAKKKVELLKETVCK